jgi:hypothetical protein
MRYACSNLLMPTSPLDAYFSGHSWCCRFPSDGTYLSRTHSLWRTSVDETKCTRVVVVWISIDFGCGDFHCRTPTERHVLPLIHNAAVHWQNWLEHFSHLASFSSQWWSQVVFGIGLLLSKDGFKQTGRGGVLPSTISAMKWRDNAITKHRSCCSSRLSGQEELLDRCARRQSVLSRYLWARSSSSCLAFHSPQVGWLWSRRIFATH